MAENSWSLSGQKRKDNSQDCILEHSLKQQVKQLGIVIKRYTVV